ncbi:leucyl aminopeptidase LAP [Toxoplasma gondii GAB2-2007-GAL-DOM2]|uniref:Leucyl aminopeptidase LAP n=7 Tax=Toxoplasma gondii TaxID=5811 RepID=A0A125YKM7_TOXGV|nr:leucyl aminopeptidase LAP [Toxoplasma gondii GT1]ESS33933.1 leucyl aminopeptidase LAP [Toxoplasma gondii VEG]KAF4644518.1 leucyl aminopeptidase LAP [Toxoplasma gondii]KFG42336.1 leucyl aminopeptidase LAP [Toxoplasma gondii GAB2-2007-GAL-DOM2]KFG53425.1 leucyl aminopeptidase LAP [Toxoplasma gondii FOU]RQX73657.1 leucyl aminopeptidase LAP [Toxoplasma gondii CAST]
MVPPTPGASCLLSRTRQRNVLPLACSLCLYTVTVCSALRRDPTFLLNQLKIGPQFAHFSPFVETGRTSSHSGVSPSTFSGSLRSRQHAFTMRPSSFPAFLVKLPAKHKNQCRQSAAALAGSTACWQSSLHAPACAFPFSRRNGGHPERRDAPSLSSPRSSPASFLSVLRPVTSPLPCVWKAGTPHARPLALPLPPVRTASLATFSSGSSPRLSSNHSEMSRVPAPLTVVKTDPTAIPFVGCQPAKKVRMEAVDISEAEKYSGDLIVFSVLAPGCFHDAPNASQPQKGPIALPELAQKFDDAVGQGMLKDAVEAADFKAKMGSQVFVRLPSKSAPAVKHLAALGFGSIAEVTPSAVTKAAAAFASMLLRGSGEKAKTVAVVLPTCQKVCPSAEGQRKTREMKERVVTSFLETLLVELQPDLRFKGDREDGKHSGPQVEKLTLFTDDVEAVNRAIARAKVVAPGVYFAQELVNAPANYCNPVTLARAAVEMAKEAGLEAEVLQQDDIEKLKMGCYLAVAKGSLFPPQFIHLTYKSSNPKRRVAFVGKGICFDAGGYNLKTGGAQIELMKFDMGGAAAVLGAARALGELKPENVEVHFLVAACENMISAKSYRPGDVITASNGKTVEVGNTDAEGRLTLADALVYAEKTVKADTIVDVATLTGAVIVALGYKYAGLWSNKECLASSILKSAENSGEYMWHMPLAKDYAEALDSKCADMNNVGGKGKGGSIIAAVFLNKFIEQASWAHIDIAGTAWDMKTSMATGFGVRTLVEYIMDISAQTKEN